MLRFVPQPCLEFRDLLELQAAVWRHVAEVHHYADRMRLKLVEPGAVLVLRMAARTKFQRQRLAGGQLGRVLGEVERRPGVSTEILADYRRGRGRQPEGLRDGWRGARAAGVER